MDNFLKVLRFIAWLIRWALMQPPPPPEGGPPEV